MNDKNGYHSTQKQKPLRGSAYDRDENLRRNPLLST